MKYLFSLLYLLSIQASLGQIEFSLQTIDLGEIKEAYEIKTDIIIRNSGTKKLFLLKADCDRGVKVFTTKKTLEINDTALLTISFVPENAGKFNKEVKLFSSAQANASKLVVRGNLITFKADDKTACYYFGKPNKQVVPKDFPVVVHDTNIKRDNSNRMPDKASDPVEDKAIVNQKNNIEKVESLPPLLYKPNNLLFLIDVSNSMKDSLKLPLLQLALHQLIQDLRDLDFVTLVSYADSIKILVQNVNGLEKEKLFSAVDRLKARGLTKGRQAILKSEDLLLSHYIIGGNNQLILATDGKFNFYSEDEKKFVAKQQSTPIVMSVIGFGSDKEAIKNLKEISKKGNGSFIHVKRKADCEQLLMDEIKLRCKKE